MVNRIIKINDSTFRTVHGKWGEVEIGDKDKDYFRPHIKLKKWGDECWFKVSPETSKEIIPIEEKLNGKIKKLKWIDDKIEHHLYPLDPIEFEECGHTVKQLQNGGFEFEVILKEKPDTNKIILNIETKGLKFYYQPEISDEQAQIRLDLSDKLRENQSYPWKDSLPTTLEEARRHIRPENVVGSYAVYHSSKQGNYEALGGKNYKAGKAFHIYRPKIIDSNGWEVWGELDIDEQAGTLIVTIPQNFIDNALYPVRHAAGATFGWEDKGASSDQVPTIIGTHGTPSEAGTATKITAWIYGFESDKFQATLYKGTALLTPQTEEIDNWSSAAPEPEEKDLNFTNGPSVTTDQHSVCIWSEGPGYIYIAYDNITDAGIVCFGPAYNSWCATLGSACCDAYYDYNYDVRYSLYCTYEAVAPPAVPKIPRHSGTAGMPHIFGVFPSIRTPLYRRKPKVHHVA